MHLNPNRYLTGVFFIDARGSELNNLGQDKSAGTKNIIRTKALVRDGVQVPFRSGEAIRRDIRETLAREHPDTPMSPLERAGKVTVTADRFPEFQASPNDSGSFDDSCESTGGVSQCVLRPPVDAPPKLSSSPHRPLQNP